jgi:ParB-like chromosome segregation protein Spo0J
MEIKLIECQKIEFPKREATFRTFKKNIAEGIAHSIRTEGLYNPIVVRPDPNKPDHYLGVQGLHRLYAKATILHETLIECNVLDLDDQQAELAAITENLLRNELKPAQKALAVKRWQEIFAATHPGSGVKGHAGGAAKAKKTRKTKAEAESVQGSTASASANLADALASEAETSEAEAKAEGQANSAKTLAAATGTSERSAQRQLKIAGRLSESQLTICDQRGLNQGQMESLANITDEVQKSEVFTLIATGMPLDEAWDRVQPDAKKATGKSGEADDAKDAAKPDGEPQISDDEWFESSCGDMAKLLANPAKYRSDALAYRRLDEARRIFQDQSKSTLEEVKRSGVQGMFFDAVSRFVSIIHPKDWPLCGGCRGKGTNGEGGRCNGCFGGGYRLKSEEYPGGEDRHPRRRT